MVDIDAAIGFVRARGDGVDHAMLTHLRTGAPAPASILADVEAGQTPNGGWPAQGGVGVASVDATCFRLGELDALSGLQRPAATHALKWLARRQQLRGVWEEDPALAEDAPPWARPGNPEAEFFLTANAAYWLSISPLSFDDNLARATGVLLGALDDGGAWPGFLVSGWLAGAVLQRAGSFYEAARIFILLGDRVPTMSPADAAALVTALVRAGVSPDDALIKAARQRLDATQRSDGGWPGDDPRFDAQATLAALRALSTLSA